MEILLNNKDLYRAYRKWERVEHINVWFITLSIKHPENTWSQVFVSNVFTWSPLGFILLITVVDKKKLVV